MISRISIKNFAIIENSEVEFQDGLNIITGETGAGKSIVIEAVSLALGARADSTFVRSGCDKAVVQLVADTDEGEYIITREVSSQGKNLCKVNGEIVTLAQLNDCCRKIADIHGQYEHQSLLNPDHHINLIDTYHKNAIFPVREAVSADFSNYKSLERQLSQLVSGAAENARQKDFMQFQLDEITSANLSEGEDDQLEKDIALLKNSEKIFSVLSGAYHSLYDSEDCSALDLLESTSKELSGISEYSKELLEIGNGLSDICYTLEDICRQMRISRDSAVFSRDELDAAIERYEEIQGLKRKYGNSIKEILNFAEELKSKLAVVENIDAEKLRLEQALATARSELETKCSELTNLRKISAAELSQKIATQLQDLNFSNSDIQAEFESLPDFTENGMDSIRFLISTNKGEPLKPLSKIASGGELSRIMLAFKKILADYDSIPTLIFDEIDAGISGIAASVVGQKLREISKNHQIICITHLPQIAACGHQNYRIEKQSDDVSTSTNIQPIEGEDVVMEIARLLGGANITPVTLQSAKELLTASK